MKIFVKAIQDSTNELKQIQCDEMGYKILKDKTKVFGFYIYGLKTPAAEEQGFDAPIFSDNIPIELLFSDNPYIALN